MAADSEECPAVPSSEHLPAPALSASGGSPAPALSAADASWRAGSRWPRAESRVPALPVRARLAALAGAGLSRLSRATGRGAGSVVGGHAILAIEPRALARFSAGRRVVLVSGTNGKTTTTRLLASGLSAAGEQEVLTNVAGANLRAGLATALAEGQPGAPAVLEVDEAWLPTVAGEIGPTLVVLLNLSRDQLDRNNEVRHVAQKWREACQRLPAGAAVVANADDPLVAWAAAPARLVVWVGGGLVWRGDATGCPQCGGQLIFDEGPNNAWQCPSCELARPQPRVWLEGGGRAVDLSGGVHDVVLGLPGRANLANATMALAAIGALGYCGDEVTKALGAMREVTEVAGRYAVVEHAGTVGRLLLAKNPAGWAEIFAMLSPPPASIVVAINARTADGHDPSWLWDVPFERLRSRRVIATGERYLDLAVRLHYAEVDHVTEPGLLAALAAAGPGNADVVANYTSFHQILAALKRARA